MKCFITQNVYKYIYFENEYYQIWIALEMTHLLYHCPKIHMAILRSQIQHIIPTQNIDV